MRSAGRTGRHVVFSGSGRPLELREGAVPAPGPGEMVVAVTLAGVCGTDAHRLRGEVAEPVEPISLGHEGIGQVLALGAGVDRDRAGTPLAAGDRVYWAPARPCGRCRSCGLLDDPASCERLAASSPADVPNATTFRDYATLPAGSSVFRAPADVPAEAIIAFGCAMPTALAGVRRAGGIVVGSSVVIQGCGPVGLATTLLARLAGAADVIVIGAPAGRLEVARQLGATRVIPLEVTSAEDRTDAVLEATGGRGGDLVVEAAGRLEAFEQGLPLMARRATYLILGLFSGSGVGAVDPIRVNNLNQSIVGSLGYRPGDLARTVAVAERHHRDLRLGDLVTHRFPLERTEDAIVAMATGGPVKVVVEPAAAPA